MKTVVLKKSLVIAGKLRAKGEVVTVPDDWNGDKVAKVLKQYDKTKQDTD